VYGERHPSTIRFNRKDLRELCAPGPSLRSQFNRDNPILPRKMTGWRALTRHPDTALQLGFYSRLLLKPSGPDLSSYRFTAFATDPEPEGDAVWSPDGKPLFLPGRSIMSSRSLRRTHGADGSTAYLRPPRLRDPHLVTQWDPSIFNA
jgi:hypothetical protein